MMRWKIDVIVNADLDANVDLKVEENVGAIIRVKHGTNCGEIKLDATMDTNLQEKWMQT